MSSSLWGRLAAVLCLALAAGMAPRAEAGYSAVVAFGDSLTDTGNLSLASGGLYPGPGYYDGRYSNGPLWVETLAQNLGLAAPTPSLLGGTNFAFANAETGADPGGELSGVPNLDEQVNNYKNSAYAANAGSQLFVVWAGANDLLHQKAVDPARSVSNILAQISALAKLGGREFIVPNLPQLGYTPVIASMGPQVAQGVNLLTQGFNAQLAAGLSQLAPQLGVTIHQLDIDALFGNLRSRPGDYGLTNTTDSALLTGVTGDAANGYVFWDYLHPTARVHTLIGQAAAGTVPEPSSLLMVGVAVVFGTAVARVRARRAA